MSYTMQDVLIPAGQSMSNAIDCTGYTILRIIMPTPWDPAPISFRLSPDGVNYHDLFHTISQTFTSYEAIVPVVPPGAAVNMPAGTGTGIAFVKIRSGSRAAPVVQSADRTFTFVLDPLPVGIPAGPAGPQGLPGNTGPTGAAGPVGVTGAGATGPAGPQGASGPIGAVGPTGGQGPIGLQGAQGIQGSTGALGPTGPTGTFNLKGVTDGSDAVAGNIGEYILATVLVGAAKAANTGVNVDVTSITLPAGDWDVQGQIWIAATGTRDTLAAVNVTGIAAWVSKVSATIPQVPAGSLQSFFGINIALAAANLPVLTSGRVRFSLSAPTTIYLSGIVTFTGAGPLGLYGFVGARRMR